MLGGRADHHPERAAAAERDPQHRADPDRRLGGIDPVVKRSAHGPGAGQRLDAGNRGHQANLVSGIDGAVRRASRFLVSGASGFNLLSAWNRA